MWISDHLLPLWHPASATKSRTGPAALISERFSISMSWRMMVMISVVVGCVYGVIIAPLGITCSVWTDGASCSTCHKHRAALSQRWTSSIVRVRCLSLVRAGDWCALGERGCFGRHTAKREGPFLSLVNDWTLLNDQYWSEEDGDEECCSTEVERTVRRTHANISD